MLSLLGDRREAGKESQGSLLGQRGAGTAFSDQVCMSAANARNFQYMLEIQHHKNENIFARELHEVS